jgi:hypothetical protein
MEIPSRPEPFSMSTTNASSPDKADHGVLRFTVRPFDATGIFAGRACLPGIGPLGMCLRSMNPPLPGRQKCAWARSSAHVGQVCPTYFLSLQQGNGAEGLAGINPKPE